METLERPIPSVFIVPLTELMVGICVFIALLYGLRELTLLGLLVLGITIGTRLWSRLSLSGVRCSAGVDKHKLFPGESFVLQVKAENARFLPVWLHMSMPFEGVFDSASGEMRFAGECGLLWYQKMRFTRELVARRRGAYRVGPVRMKVGRSVWFFSQAEVDGG